MSITSRFFRFPLDYIVSLSITSFASSLVGIPTSLFPFYQPNNLEPLNLLPGVYWPSYRRLFLQRPPEPWVSFMDHIVPESGDFFSTGDRLRVRKLSPGTPTEALTFFSFLYFDLCYWWESHFLIPTLLRLTLFFVLSFVGLDIGRRSESQRKIVGNDCLWLFRSFVFFLHQTSQEWNRSFSSNVSHPGRNRWRDVRVSMCRRMYHRRTLVLQFYIKEYRTNK